MTTTEPESTQPTAPTDTLGPDQKEENLFRALRRTFNEFSERNVDDDLDERVKEFIIWYGWQLDAHARADFVEELRERLAMALGPERAAKLEAFHRVEELMARSYNELKGVKPASHDSSLGFVSKHPSGPILGTVLHSFGAGLKAALGELLLHKGATAVSRLQAMRLAEQLVSKDPEAVQAAVSEIAKNPAAMSRLRHLTSRSIAHGTTTPMTPPDVTGSVSYMPPQRQQRAAGGHLRDDEQAEQLSAKEQHRISRQDPLKRLAARNPLARAAIDALLLDQASTARVVGDAVSRLSAKDPQAAREIIRSFVDRKSEELIEREPKTCRALCAAIEALPGSAGASAGVKRFFDMLHAAAGQLYDGDRFKGLRDPSAVFGRGVPRLLRDRLEGWAMGQNGKELARMLAHPESAAAFRELARAEFDSEGWRKGIATLSRLGGRSAVQVGVREPERAARAAGGGVGAAKMIRSAEAARKEIAAATKPLMTQPDENIAHALRLAARYS